jgi:hypothetical protein
MTATSGVDFPAARREPATAPVLPARLTSLDLWRGVVMVLMAIDHVRVYSGVPAGGPTAGVFFTRWVTHFCAPGFVFLAGIAAFLYGRKVADPRELSRYLLTRGLLLVVLELTVVRLSWTFTPASLAAPLAGVIWMLGWCMVLMSPLVRLPTTAIAIFGLATIFAQEAPASGLPPHGARRFVCPKAQKHGVTKMALCRPLHESHLRDQRRFDPLHIGHLLGRHASAPP